MSLYVSFSFGDLLRLVKRATFCVFKKKAIIEFGKLVYRFTVSVWWQTRPEAVSV